MDSGHETLGDSELIIDNLSKRSKTIGGTGGVGYNIHGGLILFLVNSHNEHRGISGRSRDDDLLGTSNHMGGSGLGGGEYSSGLNDVVGTSRSPLDLGGVHLTRYLDGLSINGELIISSGANFTTVLSMYGIILEHVLHIIGGDEWIIDCNNINHRVVLGSTHDKSSNTSKSINTNLYGLQGFLGSLTVDNISEFWLEGCSSNKETVNIRFGRKSRSSGSGCGSSVKDTAFSSNLGTCDLSKVLTDSLVGILSLLRGGSQTSSDGPNGFVGNDSVLPVLLCENIGVSLDLRKHVFVSSSSLTCLKRLSTARHNLKSLIQSIFRLLGNLLIALSLSTTL
mmetsp:Transcript_17888/g.26244  ORF Transcript_17888/g.26244 Transcript_17888/m.26244 type:complete len:338 (-) Transcript_17888:429-1442(-)